MLCVAAESVEPAIREMAKGWTFPHAIAAGEATKPDAFAAMDVALACSGTVTTELAAQGAPMIVGYKLGWVTWAIARLFLMRSRFIRLVNVAAGREVAPEFVQTRPHARQPHRRSRAPAVQPRGPRSAKATRTPR